MFQSLIEFVPLDPEFAMLTARPPYFSLQLFDTLIFTSCYLNLSSKQNCNKVRE